MFDIGFSEIFLFGVIALIVLGPEKLPQAARTAGQWYAKLRRTVTTIQSEIEAELDLAETRQQMQDELASIRKTRSDMANEMAQMRGSLKSFENSQNDSLKADQFTTLNKEQQNSPAEFSYAYDSDAPDDLEKTSESLLSGSQANDQADNQANDQTATKDSHQNENKINGQTVVIDKPPLMTRPWENMWFRLGAYDQVRRLPAAPYLPNYKADILLYTNDAADSTRSKTTLETQQAEK